jgi:hypothetical protein
MIEEDTVVKAYPITITSYCGCSNRPHQLNAARKKEAKLGMVRGEWSEMPIAGKPIVDFSQRISAAKLKMLLTIPLMCTIFV